MKNVFRYLSLALGACLCLGGVSRAIEGWETDFAEGMRKAQATKSMALVEFTGSDWCPPCMHLRSQILPTSEFTSFAKKNGLTLVELDFPRDEAKVTPEQRETREKLRVLYGVEGFPTMLVVDDQGRPYEAVVGSAPTTQAYIAGLQAALDKKARFDAEVAAARKLSGMARAEALNSALQMLPVPYRMFQKEVVEEIISNDPTDTLGVRKAQEMARLLVKQKAELENFYAQFRGKVDAASVQKGQADALEMLKREDLLPIIRLKLCRFVSDSYAMQQDLPHTLEYLKAAIEAAPDSTEAQYLRPWCAQLEAKLGEAQQGK